MSIPNHREIPDEYVNEIIYYASVGFNVTDTQNSIIVFNFADRTITIYNEISFHSPEGPQSEEYLFSTFDCVHIIRSQETNIIKVEFYTTKVLYIKTNNASDHNAIFSIFREITKNIRALFKKELLMQDWHDHIKTYDCKFRNRPETVQFDIYNGIVTVKYKDHNLPCIVIPMDSTVTISKRNTLHITSTLRKLFLQLSTEDMNEAIQLLANCRHRIVPPPKVVDDLTYGKLGDLVGYAQNLIEEDEMYGEECLAHYHELCEVLKYVGKKKYATKQQKIDWANEKFAKKEKDEPAPEFPEDDLMQFVEQTNPYAEVRRLESLGKGGFGEVFKAQRKSDGKMVALKVLKHTIKERYAKLGAEIARMALWKHEFLIGIDKCYLFDNRVYITMPYCKSGSIKQVVKDKSHTFTLCDVAYVCQCVLMALEYIHAQGFIHRDIKPANILMMENGGIKLIDFGLVTRKVLKPKTRSGSKQYMAPELILQKVYDEKVDIWSLGCVTQELAEGKSPYREDGIVKLLYRTVTQGAMGLRRIKYWDNVFVDFVSECFVFEPEARPSASQLLQHPFIEWAQKSYFYKKYYKLN